MSSINIIRLSTALRKIVATLNAEGREGKRKGAQSFTKEIRYEFMR